jgi:hypothetical protein
MKHVLSLTVVALLAGSASAIEIRLGANRDYTTGKLTLDVSQTGSFSIFLNIGTDDGNVAFMNFLFDATPLRSMETDGYTVEGRVFRMTRNDGEPWSDYLEWDGDPNMEKYFGAYGDRQGIYRGTDGDGRWYEADEIIIHGREIGEYELFFENAQSAEGAPRPPSLFNSQNIQRGYAVNLDLPGFIHFSNAWWDPDANDGRGFRVPFLVNVTPEPASFAVLVLGGLALLRRRVN